MNDTAMYADQGQTATMNTVEQNVIEGEKRGEDIGKGQRQQDVGGPVTGEYLTMAYFLRKIADHAA